MVELSGLIFPTFFIYVGNVPHPGGEYFPCSRGKIPMRMGMVCNLYGIAQQLN